MTAIEILPALCLFEALYEKYDNFSMRFVELLSPNTGPDEKEITAVVIALSFIHKYIWDQPDDSTVELDQNSDVNGIKMEAVIHSFDTL
jgi:hypothetical protein